MIKVLIVDDEPPIIRSIKYLIELSNMDFEVIGSASHGREAISKIEKEKPDLVITDIRMPVMDGLKLLSYIKLNYPEITSIILSGYQEFNFALEALHLGVFDYLLKPVSSFSLYEVLKKIYDLNQEKLVNYETKYINAIINREKIDTFKSITYPGNKNYTLMLLCVGFFPLIDLDDLTPIREFWDNIGLKKKLLNDIPKHIKLRAMDGKSNVEIYLLFESKFHMKDDIKELSLKINKIISISNLPVTLLISSTITEIEKMGILAQELRINLIKNIRIGMSQTIWMDETKKNSCLINNDLLSIDASFEKSLINLIKQKDMQMFRKELRKFFEHWNANKYTQIMIERLLKLFANECCRKIFPVLPERIAELDLEINMVLSNSITIDEMFLGIDYLLEDLFCNTKIAETDSESTKDLIERLEIFLMENYAEKITHQTLAEMFGFVPSYLSKLFKDYKGVSPSDYLTNLRVIKSKELINAYPQMLIKDIALAVGYADPHYFSKVFQKTTGIWPSEYSNNL